MSTTTLVPLAEYLATSYRPDCDYLEGELLERNVGERDHSRLQYLLLRFLGGREAEWGIVVLPEQRVQVQARRFRVPDVTVVLASDPEDQIVKTAPFLCVEILSPRDTMNEMQERVDDYLGFGVRYVWVVNPKTRRGFIYTSEGMHEAKDGVLSTSNPDIRVPLSELHNAALSRPEAGFTGHE